VQALQNAKLKIREQVPIFNCRFLHLRCATAVALGLIAALYLPRSDDKMGGTKSSEIKEVNEFREKITKFPNFPNLLKFFIRGKTSSVSVYSDLGCCRKAVKEKISTKGQARLKPKVDIYYFNDSQSYPKSASAWKRNKVSPKVFGRSGFNLSCDVICEMFFGICRANSAVT